MRKWLNVFLAVVMTVMYSMTIVLPAYAADLPGVSVPVTISLSGTLPYPAEDYTVVLKADDAAYPMPDGSVDGAYSLIITGENAGSFPVITYEQVGFYTYKIYQAAGTNQKCTYDDTVYALTVTISNKEDYSGLEATAVLYPDAQGEKLYEAGFHNEYETETPPVPSEISPDTPTEISTEVEKIPVAETLPPVVSFIAPRTGDDATPFLYIFLMLISLGVLSGLVLTRKKKKIEE